MITVKDIQTRIAKILTDNGFNVIAGEVIEGFERPAVFIQVLPSKITKQACGGTLENVVDTVELKYFSAVETLEDCINVSEKFKQLFYYPTFDIQDRHITVESMEFEIENKVLFAYFDIEFMQSRSDEEYEEMSDFVLREEYNNGIA